VTMERKAQLGSFGMMTDGKRKALSLHVGQSDGDSDLNSCFASRYHILVSNDVEDGYRDFELSYISLQQFIISD
jgi:hypothetical protein